MARLVRLVPAAALAGGYVALHRLGRTYGSTRCEREAVLPGDDLVRNPHMACTHAISIAATPDKVWPWLVQMGWHRGGWYTARWVDRLLFPGNRASAERIVPEWQHLEVGDFVPDGAPSTECGFVVQRLKPNTHLVLRSDSHLPLSWRTRHRARVDWTWTFILEPINGGRRTRLVFRWRARTAPRWLRALCWATIVPADSVMSRDMLRGIRARAEGAGIGAAESAAA